MPLYGQSSGSPLWFMQTGLGPRFRLPSVDRRHPSSVAMGGLLLRLRACRKGTYRELMKRGDRGHAHHHQSLALGIGADALGELYWLPDELPDALR